MPKVPTTTTRHRSLSPHLPDKKLHKLFDQLVGTIKVHTEKEPEILDNASDHSQSSSTRRKRTMITDLLKLGRKSESDNSSPSTRAQRKFIARMLKFGKSEKSEAVSDMASCSSFSVSSDAPSSASSSDAEDSGSHKEIDVEEPLPTSIPVLPPDVPDAPSITSPLSHSTSDAAIQAATRKESAAEMEREGVTSVNLDADDETEEVSKKKSASRKKKRSSRKQKSTSKDSTSTLVSESGSADQVVALGTTTDAPLVSALAPESGSADHVVTPATTATTTVIDYSAPVSVPAASSGLAPAPAPAASSASTPPPAPATALVPNLSSTPAPVPLTVSASVPASASAADSTSPAPTPSPTPSFPFNHFPPTPRPEGTRRALRREHGFYHKSHYEIAWVPEFGDRDTPPQTLEEVLPPWYPVLTRDAGASSRSATQGSSLPELGASIAAAAAYPSHKESPPSAPATNAGIGIITGASSSGSNRATVLKRGREPEDENVDPTEARRSMRKRRVGLNKAVGV
ncbi:hypothetical protein L208DRAFT_59967 [Tricholoma matsutake]|nr:hypothetical protein L208DRAFT_59967 [Tricholoma matsutake 945]